LVTHLSEQHLATLNPGARATLTFDAHPNDPVEAEVATIGDLVDTSSRTVDVRLKLTAPGLRLRPGMFARGSLDIERREDVLHVPRSALQARGERATLWVVVDDKAQSRDVEILMQSDTRAVVTPLEPSDQVINNPSRKLRPDTPVRIKGRKDNDATPSATTQGKSKHALASPKASAPVAERDATSGKTSGNAP